MRLLKLHFDKNDLRHAVVVTNMYDHRWYDEYLQKEEDKTVLVDAYNKEFFQQHFPTDEEQELLQELSKREQVEPIAIRVCREWTQAHPTDTTVTQCLEFICKKFYDGEYNFPDEKRMWDAATMAVAKRFGKVPDGLLKRAQKIDELQVFKKRKFSD